LQSGQTSGLEKSCAPWCRSSKVNSFLFLGANKSSISSSSNAATFSQAVLEPVIDGAGYCVRLPVQYPYSLRSKRYLPSDWDDIGDTSSSSAPLWACKAARKERKETNRQKSIDPPHLALKASTSSVMSDYYRRQGTGPCRRHSVEPFHESVQGRNQCNCGREE
jgi:hypothetical protein